MTFSVQSAWYWHDLASCNVILMWPLLWNLDEDCYLDCWTPHSLRIILHPCGHRVLHCSTVFYFTFHYRSQLNFLGRALHYLINLKKTVKMIKKKWQLPEWYMKWTTKFTLFSYFAVENFDGKKRRIKESLSAIAQRLKKSDTSATNTRSTNFSCTTLSYVTDGVSFLENINQLGLSGDTIQSSTCLESSDSEEDMDEYTYTSSQDMFNTPCKRKRTETRATRKRRRGVVRNVVQSSLRQNKQELDTESLAQKLVNALEHYHRNKTITEEREKKHRAYERVVNVCASQIGMLGEELEYYVQRMELVYVRERGSLALRSKKIRSRFTRNFLWRVVEREWSLSRSWIASKFTLRSTHGNLW